MGVPGGVLLGLLVQVGFGPPFPFFHRRERKEGRRRRKEGAAPPPLVQFGLGKGETRATSWPFFPLSTKAH